MAKKPTPVDTLSGPRFVLSGRIVTMNARHAVIESGRACIDQGTIRAVTSADKPLPAEFADAPLIATRGTIYPGLIELHNHLSYNVIPPWQVPKRFGNRGQWADHPEKRRLISQPMQVIASVQGTIEALVRYVEAKCLVGGVTTSQGITLVNAHGIEHRYRGVVRNVEQTDDEALPEAATRIPDVDDAAKFLQRLTQLKGRRLLLHLAEGVDERARGHFERLKISGSKWAITPNLVGIHAAGLRDKDFDVFAKRGGGIVWSPLSNLLLYGETADIRRAKSAGVRISLGSDWTPSGSKNLLSELKVAWAVSEELGGVFKPRELVEMVTSTPAALLGWQDSLGSISAGCRADFTVVRGASGDPYEKLLTTQERDVLLVFVNGIPRYGRETLMQEAGTDLFADGTRPKLEPWRVGGEKYRFNFEQAVEDPLIPTVTLKEAERRLRDGLRRLPELASASLDPLGASLDLQMPTNLGLVGASAAGQAPSVWRIELENEHQPFSGTTVRPLSPSRLAPFFAVNESLPETLTAIELDPLTIADDPDYFEGLVRQPNLPEYLKSALPKLHGTKRPKLEAAGVSSVSVARDPVTRASNLADLASLPDPLSMADRQLLVRQARLLLEHVYVHLPLKRAAHAVDPVQRLRLLDATLEQAKRSARPVPGTQGISFHRALLEIFTELRDLHTVYLLPPPYRDISAVLPFLVEQCFEMDAEGEPRSRYLVSKVSPELAHPTFKPGVRIVYWNGAPIEAAVRENGERQAGSNLPARFARGLATLTIRPLVRSLPPDEEWVVIGYRTPDGQSLELKLPWELRGLPAQNAPGRRARGTPVALGQQAAIGVDVQMDAVNDVKREVYAHAAARAARSIARGDANTARVGEDLPTALPGLVRAREISTESGSFGYLRIFSFSVPDADAFVREVARLLAKLPRKGLILDVRNNGGGLIWAAERLLQLFSVRPVQPQQAQLLSTSVMLQIARRNMPSPLDPSFSLAPWIESIERSTMTGELHTTAHPLTPQPNAIGRQYFGPVALITDALCYSATDIFVAGFQDHAIGPIIATDENIGAGGANVWDYELLRMLVAEAPVARGGARGAAELFPPLPAGCGFRVAARRMLRVGDSAGIPLEDLGITLDEPRYFMTRDDILYSNRDLLEYAGRRLAAEQPAKRPTGGRRPSRARGKS